MGYHVLGSEAGNYVIYCLLRIRPRPKNGEIKEGTVGKGGGGGLEAVEAEAHQTATASVFLSRRI